MARLLHVTSPLQHGADVASVQRRLKRLGFAPGPIDGQYGPATAAAVRAFQTWKHLVPDGAVGPLTHAALIASAPRRRPHGGAGRRALAEARRWVGTHEDPPGSNRTPFGAWFGANGVAWCNIFVSYCFRVAAETTIADGFDGPGVTPRGCAYVPTTEAWLRAGEMWFEDAPPAPGDLAVFNWDGGDPDHIGIVESATDDRFVTIEGNSTQGSRTDFGGAVLRHVRSYADVEGFGRVGKHL